MIKLTFSAVKKSLKKIVNRTQRVNCDFAGEAKAPSANELNNFFRRAVTKKSREFSNELFNLSKTTWINNSILLSKIEPDE